MSSMIRSEAALCTVKKFPGGAVMFRVQGQDRAVNCAGVSRRSFLQAGFLGLAGLSLADFLCLQKQAAAAGRTSKNTAVILLWMDGGPSQLETFDPKPDAPAEVRGPY